MAYKDESTDQMVGRWPVAVDELERLARGGGGQDEIDRLSALIRRRYRGAIVRRADELLAVKQ